MSGLPRRPRTPILVHQSRIDFGLPSPQTPSYNNGNWPPSFTNVPHVNEPQDNKDSNASGSVALITRPPVSLLTSRSTTPSSKSILISPISEITPSPSIEDDEKLACELASPTSRRSARIQSKAKVEGKSASRKSGDHYADSLTVVTNPKRTVAVKRPTSKKLSIKLDTAVISQAEPAASPFEVSPTSDGELPTPHSTEWQLMYPPGGSTHPSYPWPPADPRLTFHTHSIPLRNGVPDVALLSTLSLPEGWRQATWCGLHPVVFDPHQQLFKLTPVGPLPLTCEELHQGGLHDYAPGGKSHPEAGLLPTLLSFSDGSDADVFNFEGVNWTLPWTDWGDSKVTSSSKIVKHEAVDPIETALLTLDTPPHYLEARDCPDGIIDIEEGWRWMCEHEEMPGLVFSPTPGKTWAKTGVYLTSRKGKAPIASLMANAMAESEEDNKERYLVKQDAREFDAFKSVATPVYVNIALLQDVEFTLVELLTYFPSHYQWRKGGDRLARSGISAGDIADYINMSRRLPGTSICKKGTVNNRVFWNTLDDGARVKVSLSELEAPGFTAKDWTYSIWETTNYPLLALAYGLVELPSGPDEGPLTLLIKWCRENKHYKALLSDVPDLLMMAGIDNLVKAGNREDPDQEALLGHAEAVKKDRKRVLKELKILKEREEDDSQEKRTSKKRRLE
jgi:hypothetical protein